LSKTKTFIKNILFDLGGVLIDIDTSRTEKGLAKFTKENLALRDLEALLYEKLHLFEKGQYSEELFINLLLKHSHYKIQALDIITVWNSMLTFIDEDRLHVLKKLSKDYKLYALSNNNPIHFQWLQKKNAELAKGEEFFELFQSMYFSHLIEVRKPDKAAFEIVLNDAEILASQTLFIDDLEENILAAQDLGFLTFHKKSDKGFIEFCKTL